METESSSATSQLTKSVYKHPAGIDFRRLARAQQYRDSLNGCVSASGYGLQNHPGGCFAVSFLRFLPHIYYIYIYIYIFPPIASLTGVYNKKVLNIWFKLKT